VLFPSVAQASPVNCAKLYEALVFMHKRFRIFTPHECGGDNRVLGANT
jgi:hypothetical protein